MNRILPSLLLSAFAAGASASPEATINAGVAVAAQAPSHPALVSPQAGDDRFCIRDTGTRIKHRAHKGCLAVNGRSYSREDIDRTGAIDLGDALQRLDPSISIRRR